MHGMCLQWPKQLNAPLKAVDPEVADIIELEKARQWKVSPGSLFFVLTKLLILLCWLVLIRSLASELYFQLVSLLGQ